MKKILLLVFIVSLSVMFSACASTGGGSGASGALRSSLIGSYNYRSVVADISISGNKQLSVATHDQRSFIVSGEKSPDYVGTARWGFGQRWNVPTASGNPLAEDMTKAISASLSQKGFKVVEVKVLHSDSLEVALSKLKSSNSELLLLFTVKNWKSDALQNAALAYDANLAIYNNDGQILKKKTIVGKDNLGGSLFMPVRHAKKVVPIAFKHKIEELFNNPEISRLLQ